MENFIIVSDKIKSGDHIIDLEKTGVVIMGKPEFTPVICVEVLNDGEDLIWESLDGKSSACDASFHFRKIQYV